MNVQQHLLIHLAEECVEAAHRASKALRFGLGEIQDGQDKDNADRLSEEITDVLGIIALLEQRGEIRVDRSPEALARKANKVTQYLVKAQELGTLDAAITLNYGLDRPFLEHAE